MSTLTLAGIVADLKASLLDSGDKFTAAADADFKRHVGAAVSDLARVRPRTVVGSVTLTADESWYAAPADLVATKFSRWGEWAKRDYNYWDALYPKCLPKLAARERNGATMLELSPAPTAQQIAAYGSAYEYFYLGSHSLTDVASTVADADRGLLLLRAQAEAMKELAHRGVGKPVALRDGMSITPRNGTPAGLFDQLMREFEKQAGA
ncbi:MAG: hypothetical protein RIR00_2702 [Pseudomonadota bacterium]